MKLKTLALFSAMALFAALGIRAQTPAPTTSGQIITFDVGPKGTYPFGINPSGEITGAFLDASSVLHGFLRAADGTITAFEAQGAGNGINEGTNPLSISASGQITGYYIDASFMVSRLRARRGRHHHYVRCCGRVRYQSYKHQPERHGHGILR